MSMTDKQNLGYLGEDFQFKLVHAFMEDKEFFKDMSSIVDQNMFTNPTLRTYVGVMKEYYEEWETVPSYSVMGMCLNEKAHNDIERDYMKATNDKIMNETTEGIDYIKDSASKFFKQQNIIKTANKILQIAGNGDIQQYERCVELLNDALNQGSKEDLGSTVFDDVGETLSDDYRVAIPTGIGKLDETLEGGLGKGELGVIIGPSSFGKAQPLHSKILTPYGFRTMGEMAVGDEVIGRDGKTYNITGVFPQGVRPIYKVKFSNGAECECDIEHLWNVKSKHDVKYRTLTLGEIKKSNLKFQVQNCEPIEFDENEDEINGSFAAISLRESGNAICDELMFSSKNTRLDLIRGFLDYGGYVCDNGHVWYVGNDNEQTKQIANIIRSLGGHAKTIINDGDIIIDIVFKDDNIVLFSDEEKQNRVVYESEPIYIEHIEYIGEEEAQCIMVDSEEHLYITDDFIVTHNTSMTTAMAAFAATHKCEQNNNGGYKVLQIVFEDRIKQIQRKHIGRITKIEAKDLSKPNNIQNVREQLEKYEDREILGKNLKIVKFPSGEITASYLYRYIKKQINAGFKPDLVIIDYFECLSHSGESTTNEWEKEGKTMRKLESMASDLDIAIWLPTQGVKDSVNLELVTMDKAGGSFKKIQIAHIVMSIARTMEDIDANKATIALLKNRAGKSGQVFNNVEFNNGTCIISTDNVDEFDNMLEYKKNTQKMNNELASKIFEMSQRKK